MSKEAQNPASENTAPETANPADPVAQLKAALAAAEDKAAKNWDSYLRGVAELDNQRKRGQRDLEQALKYGAERLLGDLLPVKDSLEMALATLGDKPEAASLRTGVDMTLKLLSTALERQGVSEISPAKGEAFDHEWHEAMAAQESAEVAPDRVLATVQKGYKLNGRLLRPARVLVARAPAQKG
ncbi:MAG TPA: nucleotide exchange factor GrpE [Gammaproteobacteria bacterium]|nr:nucleotide exchange factor GrpE [Gammaproteobacteria bacterium]